MTALPVAKSPVAPAKKWWARRRWRDGRVGLSWREFRVLAAGAARKRAAGGKLLLFADRIIIAE
jgi:hypothetical protein